MTLVITEPPAQVAAPWRIDAADPADGPALDALFAASSRESVWRRFFAPYPTLPPAYRKAVLAGDPYEHDAVVARLPGGGLAGVASLVPDRRAAAGTAELGVLVRDDWQRCGVGRALVEALLERGRERGVRRVVASVLPGRSGLLRAFSRHLELERAVRDSDALTGVYRL
ncbi:GNAT family N-acetyltransferase [Streptomyces sp. A7024]|uniref:GNAT family N-acetyltransferase n=1 Tax=Streptomyces coryli TaxID=1128680 RepID=A0A6G4UDR0_9ACTN|nr:GNAT family N-acetyltransferase [Streptomyces coryli]NGN69518.1 GNAT family N-acetyltransferase [Streptomyces coryli]